MAANVQSMCHYWKNFDLQELQKELDLTATDLANRQDESDASRKRLVEQSRDFKKNTPEDIRKIVGPLLKSFQSEVDALSKRSKASEAAFLSVYKKLIDLPDPVPSLELALQFQKKAQKLQDFEIENKQLRDTLTEYNHEFAEVKNQEVTIKQLKDKVREYEDKLESTAEARAKEKEKELQRLFTEKERQLQETQLSLAKKLGEAEQRITSLQHALETVQSELFDVRAKYDESTSAKSDEMEMVMGDLERANERATAAEREVDQLKRQLASATQNLQQAEQMQNAPDMEQAIDILKRSSLEVELAAKEKEIAQLVEDVQRLQAAINKQREASEKQVAKLEEQLTAKSKAFLMLEEKMRSQEDYEELKRELDVMKSIEFQSSEDGEQAKTKSLEMLLLEKNKALQSENTQLKVGNKDLTGIPNCMVNNSEELAKPAETREKPPSKPSHQRSKSMTSSKSSSASSNGVVRSKSSPHPQSNVSPSVNGSHNHVPSPGLQFYGMGSPGQGHQELVTRLNGPKLDHQNNGQTLETAVVAKTVRELLSIHNLGQRLFAKHVLGLSQGTVSELLSKPKSWDKLTEKGRESYRKMYAWASDERNVLALKDLSPRKGAQPLVTSVKREDHATEERIAQILSDAKQAMVGKKNVPEQINFHDRLSDAMVASIYQQEMLKMAGVTDTHEALTMNANLVAAHRAAVAHHATQHGIASNKHNKEPRLRSPTGSNRKERVHSNTHVNNVNHHGTGTAESDENAQEMVVRIYRAELAKLAQAAEKAGNMAASTMYQQELARLAQNIQQKHFHDELELRHVEHVRRKMSSGSGGRHHAPRVKMEPEERVLEGAADLSNEPQDLSKHSRYNAEAEESPSGRHSGSAFKLVSPHLNGHDDVEMEIEMETGEYGAHIPSDCVSPLQRMQNIANSLMTRNNQACTTAKPLKAVLPPVTQEQFDKFSNVLTEDLVKKVKETLSQYSISQRLFGENVLGLSQGSVSDLLARPKPWHMLTQKGREPFIRMQLFLEDAEAIPKLVATQYRIPPDKLMRSDSSSQLYNPDGPLSPPLPAPPDTPAHTCSRPPTAPPSSQQDPLLEAAVCGHYFGFYTNSIFEIAAMTPDLDTVELTSKIKDVLQFHNLGQKLFGEAVLGLSQGSVSELLSKPKPWSVLSIKGREPFVRMLLWLNDPYNIEKLKLYQTEAKASKRRKSSMDEQRSCETPIKRPRVFFTEEQKETLRNAYANDPYPNQSTIEGLASDLNVGVKTVVNWFHNHRMRAKQHQHTGSSSSSSYDYNPMSVKSEPGEENSNMSDGTSASGDTPTCGYKPGPVNGDTNQWLFPQFEPVRRSNSSDSKHDEEEMALNCSMNSRRGDRERRGDKMECGSSSTLLTPVTAASACSQSGVKKRKSSNPKWVYEGMQLDKTQQRNIPSDFAAVESDDGEKFTENNSMKQTENMDSENDDDDEDDKPLSDIKRDNSGSPVLKTDLGVRTSKIHVEKLQKAILTADESWDDEFDRKASIDKIQKNLYEAHNQDEDWEF